MLPKITNPNSVITYCRQVLFGVLICLFFPLNALPNKRDYQQFLRAVATDNFDELLRTYNQLTTDKPKNTDLHIKLNLQMAAYFAKKGAYELAAEYELKAYKSITSKPSEYNFNHFCLIGDIASNYALAEKWDEARNYLNLSFQYAKKYQDLHCLGSANNNLGLFYEQINKPDSALLAYQKGLSYLNVLSGRKESYFLQGLINGNMAKIYAKKGLRSLAKKHFEINLEHSKKAEDFASYYWSLLLYTQHLLKWNELSYGESLFKQAADSNSFGSEYTKRYAQTLLMLEFKKNNPGKFKWFSNYLAYTDSLENKIKLNLQHITAEVVNQQFARIQAESEREKSQEVIKKQTYLLLLISVFAVAIILAILYVKKLRKKQTALNLQQLQNALIEKELENKQLRETELSHELQAKSADVTNLALTINDKIDWQARWLQELIRIGKLLDPIAMKEQLGQLVKEISVNTRIDKEKQPILNQVEQAGTAFVDRLKKLYPNLTLKDLEVCIFIRKQLSTKEIAALKGITPASAKTLKHRLRKKMGLNPAELFELITKV